MSAGDDSLRGAADEAAPAAGTAPVGPQAWWLRALSRLPLPVLYALTGSITWLLRHVLHYRVGVARANLEACFPGMSRAAIDGVLDRHYRGLGQVAAEFIKVASIRAEELRARVRPLRLDLVQAETSAGRSVMLLGAHQCNWEWLLQAVTLNVGVPVDAAYKPLHNHAADIGLLRLRTRFGARLVPAKKLLREIARRRRQLHAVCLMADQMPVSSPTRFWLTFLGRDTAFFPGPAQIVRATGHAVFFVAMRRTRRGHYDMEFVPLAAAGEAIESQALTERYARAVEAQVRACPEDWAWTHRRWKHARSAAERAVARDAAAPAQDDAGAAPGNAMSPVQGGAGEAPRADD